MRYQRVIRHGNALAVVIPAQVCRDLEIKRGDFLGMTLDSRESLPHDNDAPVIILWKTKVIERH